MLENPRLFAVRGMKKNVVIEEGLCDRVRVRKGAL